MFDNAFNNTYRNLRNDGGLATEIEPCFKEIDK
jgi:hypothetical protein